MKTCDIVCIIYVIHIIGSKGRKYKYGEIKKLPVILNDSERLALLNYPNKRYVTGYRNRVMIQYMFNLGLRLAEVINLEWEDIDFLSEMLIVREGKGMKDQTLYIKNNNWRGNR